MEGAIPWKTLVKQCSKGFGFEYFLNENDEFQYMRAIPSQKREEKELIQDCNTMCLLLVIVQIIFITWDQRTTTDPL